MKKQIVITLLSIWATTGFAQPQIQVPVVGDAGTLMLGNQQVQLIEEAVENSFILLHTQYQMEDNNTKRRYNAKGNDGFFGETYSIAVKTSEGYFAEEAAIHPWEYDEDFEGYRNSEDYKPVISLSEYRQFSDTVYTNQTKTYKPENAKPVIDNKIYAVTDDKFGNKGFYIKALSDDNEGWLVWVTADKPLTEKSNAKLSLLTQRFPLKADKDATQYDVTAPKTDKTIIGGIYVVPEITNIGEITFRMLGMLLEENGKWQFFPVANININTMMIQDIKQRGRNGSTPRQLVEDRKK